MNDGYERELGGINEKLAYLSKGQDEIFSRLNALAEGGCAKGERNAADIKDLKRRPERNVGLVASIVAALSAIVSIFAFFRSGGGG